MAATTSPLAVVIVGAGFAGLGMAIRLRRAGIEDFVVLEREDRVGGVWRDNHYPGVACDIESHLYSLSFEPNPDWSRVYAPGAEIRAYLESCVDKHQLRSRIRFRCAAAAARFDEEEGLWHLVTSDGDTLCCRVLILGSGHALSRPVVPEVPGRDSFSGASFHSARWDHAVPLAGKRVAVVGTGASAIQIVPAIAPEAGRLLVVQRTPAWILPRRDAPIPVERRQRYRRHPWLQRAVRRAQYWRHELTVSGFLGQSGLLRIGEWLARRFLARSVPDQRLRARLTPDYAFGCKRVLLSNDFYPALCRDNVELVSSGIAEVRPRSIVTGDGTEHPVDVLVWATGFEAAEARPPFPLTGRDGRVLRDSWHDGSRPGALHSGFYLGTTRSGFPNLFLLVGPNTGLGHNSMVFMMESQFAYILDAIFVMERRRLKWVEVRPEIAAEYNRRVQVKMADTVWSQGGCRSWYVTREGENTTLWPGTTWEYRLRLRRFDHQAYDWAARE